MPTYPSEVSRVFRSREHGGVDVRQYGRAAAAPEPGEADIAGAPGQIEQRAVGARIEGRREDLLPGAMDAERHQVVHQVVARGHAVEDGADQWLFLRQLDLAE